MSSARVSAHVGPWEIIGDELGREYAFTNLSGPGSTTKIELRCRLVVEEEKDERAPKKTRPFIYLIIHTHLFEQTESVMVSFAPIEGRDPWHAAKLETAAHVSFLVFDISEGEHLLNVLMLGRQIILHIVHGVPPFQLLLMASRQEISAMSEIPASIAYLALENDATFRIKYESLKSALIA